MLHWSSGHRLIGSPELMGRFHFDLGVRMLVFFFCELITECRVPNSDR
jgi:hypothetical protein